MSTETEEAHETGVGEDWRADLSQAAAEAPTLPDQHDFYKMPAKFGHVPVADAPLGWDPKRAFEGLYPHVRLPTQVVERVAFGSPELAPNKLYFGDNLHVMRSLPSESIDLIYIDPPFFSQQQYNALFGDQNELRSFNDIWEGGMNGYLVWLNARLYEMKRLLTQTGSLFVHLDWHASHYVKVELDKLFGYEQLQNEIVWCYRGGGVSKVRFARKHDVILWYTKGSAWTFNPQYVEYSASTKAVTGKTGKRVNKSEIDLGRGAHMPDWWSDVNALQTWSRERVGYPTQKPIGVLARVIEACSNPGDLVADFCVGGGSFVEAAQGRRIERDEEGNASYPVRPEEARRWIACDISRVAVSITADRVTKVVEAQQDEAKASGKQIAIPDFQVAHWGIYEISGLSRMSEDSFREFVLHAYEARLDSTESVIHGYKVKEPIYVGPPDPDQGVRKEQVAEFANAVLKRRGSGAGATMIAWAFTDAARKMAERIEAQKTVKLKFVKMRLIPIESPDFAAHISAKHERYEELLAFVLPPSVRVRRKKLGGRTYSFDASESAVLNPGAKIINAQWDFDYRNVFTSSPGFELQRDKKGKPVLGVEFEFPRAGTFNIAVRVQDDLGGEAIFTDSLTVG